MKRRFYLLPGKVACLACRDMIVFFIGYIIGYYIKGRGWISFHIFFTCDYLIVLKKKTLESRVFLVFYLIFKQVPSLFLKIKNICL
jgi:hypothetical protein